VIYEHKLSPSSAAIEYAYSHHSSTLRQGKGVLKGKEKKKTRKTTGALIDFLPSLALMASLLVVSQQAFWPRTG
jgi:hypothetical protein